MDNRSMAIWQEKIWASYSAGNPSSVLLLEKQDGRIHNAFSVQCSCSIHSFHLSLLDRLLSVSGVMTGVNDPLKTRMRKKCQDWKALQEDGTGPNWLFEVWNEFPEAFVKNPFIAVN